MPNIKEPEVVFCERNHIYDKSLNDKCPYCAQIENSTKQLMRQIEGDDAKSGGLLGRLLKNRSTDPYAPKHKKRGILSELEDTTVVKNQQDDDATVFKGVSDDDATVYKGVTEDDDATVYKGGADDDDATVYKSVSDGEENMVLKKPDESEFETIKTNAEPMTWTAPESPSTGFRIVLPIGNPQPQKETIPETGHRRKKVIGWLLCTDGEPDFGTSVELWDCVNDICFAADGRICIRREAEECCARIIREESSGRFSLEPVSGGLQIRVDQRILGEGVLLESGSEILFGERCFRFFPAVGVCGFEWRQK